jgi:ABC-type multidrug transport system fused ATPase/permease subunit
MIQQWLNLVLDVVVMIMAVLLTTLAVRLHSNAGFAGASMVSLMSFGENLSGIVISYTKLETSLGAISRLKTFQTDVKPEDRDDEDVFPQRNWPSSGSIKLRNVSASYEYANPRTSFIDDSFMADHCVRIESILYRLPRPSWP